MTNTQGYKNQKILHTACHRRNEDSQDKRIPHL